MKYEEKMLAIFCHRTLGECTHQCRLLTIDLDDLKRWVRVANSNSYNKLAKNLASLVFVTPNELQPLH
jgi:hypothetical protein